MEIMKDHVTDQLNISIQEFCILSFVGGFYRHRKGSIQFLAALAFSKNRMNCTLGWFEENIALIVLAQIILIILMQNS